MLQGSFKHFSHGYTNNCTYPSTHTFNKLQWKYSLARSICEVIIILVSMPIPPLHL